MNPYLHNQIENSLDHRMVDLFVNQNPGNKWLCLDDIAKWTYQTNTAKPHHRRYVGHKVMRIMGSLYSKEEQSSFLESGYVTINGSTEYAFRLKSSAQLDVDSVRSTAPQDRNKRTQPALHIEQ